MVKNKKAFKLSILLIFFISYVIYLGWRAFYTLPLRFGPISILVGILLYIAEVVGFIESIIFYITLWDTDTPATPKASIKAFPDVDIFIATYNEPCDLLFKTIIGCKNMDYPDKGKVHIYICDDGNRHEMAELCERMKVGYITRTQNTHAKAGNLNNALSRTRSPYIVTFDADMIPMHDFLMKTIPFFLKEKRIGFVQVPQNFYNPDPFQYNLFSENSIPNEQDLFSRMIQAGKEKYNAVIYAGSNTVISRQALDELGGFVVGTITEDFATGMMIQSRGYKCIYLNEIHASGLSPENLEDLYNQRIRWGRGVVQTFKAFNPFFLSGLNFMQKLMYFSALSYWYFGIWRFIFLVSPILYSLFGIIVLSASAFSILLIWLPMFILTNITFRIYSKNIRTTVWSHIYDTIMFPQITRGVILETLGAKMAKFKVTPKVSTTRKQFINKFSIVWLQISLAILTLSGAIKIIYLLCTTEFSPSYVVNIFWLSYNLYLLIMAVFFASERPKFRSYERIPISTDAIIYQSNKIIRGVTYDISETGVTIVFDTPIYLDPDSSHKIRVRTGRYSARFSAQIVHVDNFNQKYKYAFQIVEMDEEDYQQLLLILYDRVPFSSQEVINDNLIKNIRKNLISRQKRTILMNRKLPRIPVKKQFAAYSGDEEVSAFIHDFNYSYCAISADKEYSMLRIPVGQNGQIELMCTLDKELSSKNATGILIYQINNYKDIINLDILDLLSNTEYKTELSLSYILN